VGLARRGSSSGRRWLPGGMTETRSHGVFSRLGGDLRRVLTRGRRRRVKTGRGPKAKRLRRLGWLGRRQGGRRARSRWSRASMAVVSSCSGDDVVQRILLPILAMGSSNGASVVVRRRATARLRRWHGRAQSRTKGRASACRERDSGAAWPCAHGAWNSMSATAWRVPWRGHGGDAAGVQSR
jgi:hypothetical protein